MANVIAQLLGTDLGRLRRVEPDVRDLLGLTNVVGEEDPLAEEPLRGVLRLSEAGLDRAVSRADEALGGQFQGVVFLEAVRVTAHDFIAYPNVIKGPPLLMLFEFVRRGPVTLLSTVAYEPPSDFGEFRGALSAATAGVLNRIRLPWKSRCPMTKEALTCHSDGCPGTCRQYRKSDSHRVRLVCACIQPQG